MRKILFLATLLMASFGCSSKPSFTERACNDPEVVTVCSDVDAACTKASGDIRLISEKPAAASLAADKVCKSYREKCGKCGSAGPASK